MEALILDGRVVDVVNDSFPVSDAFTWVSCPSAVAVGWLYKSDSFIDPSSIPETPEQTNDRNKAEIVALERETLMSRGAREAFIVICEQQGQSAGLTNEQLYLVNPFYKKLKDVNDQVTALRAGMKEIT